MSEFIPARRGRGSSWRVNPVFTRGAPNIGPVNRAGFWEIVDVGANESTLGRTGLDAQASQATIAGENSLIPVVYGTRRVGGKVVGVKVSSVAPYTGYLVMIVVWCEAPIASIVSLEVNDGPLPPFNAIFAHHFVNGTPADDMAGGELTNYALVKSIFDPGFTDQFENVAWSAVYVAPNAPIDGFPRVAALIQGRKVARPSGAYVALDGSNDVASSIDTTAIRVNEDFTLEVATAFPDWTPASIQVIVGKWSTAGAFSWHFLLNATTGTISLRVSTDGTAFNTYTSSAAPAFTNGALGWIRVVFVKNNGTNSTATFYSSFNGIVWTPLGAVQTSTTVANIAAGVGTPVRIGADSTLFSAHTVYSVRMWTPTKNVFEFVPWEATAGATSFEDHADAVWTLTGGATVNATMTAYSENPTAVLADFCRSTRYGEGKRVDFRHALRCEQRNDEIVEGDGGSQVRHAVSIALDAPQESRTWRNVLRDYAHCWVTEEDGVLFFVRDADDGIAMAFTTANIVEGSFTLGKRGVLDQPTVIEVTYTDTTTTPWRDAIYVERYPGVLAGTVPRRASARSKPGITRYAEAVRYAIEQLNEATLSDSVASLVAFDEAAALRVGDLVSITHPAVGYSAKPFRVKKIAIPSAGRYALSLTEFDPAMYSEDVVVSPTVVETTLPVPTNPPSVSGLAIAEEYFQTASHQKWLTRLRSTWTAPTWSYPYDYAVRLVAIEGGVESIYYDGIKGDTVFVSSEVKEGLLYRIEVAVRGPFSRGATVTATTLALGNSLPPTDVTGLVGSEAGGRVHLRWTAAVDRDTLRYEIRDGSTASTWDTATLVDRVDALAYLTLGYPAGVKRFFVKALDSLGLYSANAASVDVEVLTDDSAFKSLTFAAPAWSLLAVTAFVRDGVTYGVTDFGDPVNYGHAVVSNTAAGGDFDDGTTASSVPMAMPHSSAIYFPGLAGSYVTIPDSASLDVGNTYTLDAWIYPMNLAAQNVIFSTRHGGTVGSWSLKCGPGSGGLNAGRLFLVGEGGTIVVESVDNVLSVYRWTHVALTDAAGVYKLFVDGVEVAYAITNAFTSANTAQPKLIGARTTTLEQFYGLISRVRLWSVALTQAEIVNCRQYRGLEPTTVIAAGNLVAANLKGSWLLNDGLQGSSGTLADDATTNNNNGTLVGSLTWRSWDEIFTNVIDLGATYSASFDVTHAPIAISGAVRTSILISPDNVNFYEQPPGPAVGRYVRIKQQAEGGAAIYDLTNTALRVNLTPRSEMNVVTTNATANVPRVVQLTGAYSRALNVVLTPKLYVSAVGPPPVYQSAQALYDQVEVSGGRGLRAGRALRFSGLSGSANGCYVTVGDHPQFTFTTGAADLALTIECWVKFDRNDVVQSFIAKGTGATTGEYQLRIKADGKFAFLLIDTTNLDICTIATNLTFQPNIWYHVAVTYNATNPMLGGVKIYVMGKEEPVTATQNVGSYIAMRNTAEPLIIGNQHNGATFNSPLYGVIDEVRIWNVVRTASEIAANMSEYIASNATGLVGYWKLDETTGLVAADSQTNTTQRNGTLGNAGTFNGILIGALGVATDKWWRPYDGFDVYCFNRDGTAQIANEVQTEFIGA